MESTPYETDVQQGDNTAPLLFLFVMQAVIHRLEDALPTNKPEYRFFPNDNGRLRGQRTKSAGTPFNIPNLVYFDDGAFIFQTLEDTEKAAQIIFDHFAKFGLKIHAGIETEKGDKGKETSKLNTGISSKSKTEAMCFPPSLKEAQDNEAPTEKLLLNELVFDPSHFSSYNIRTFTYWGSSRRGGRKIGFLC